MEQSLIISIWRWTTDPPTGAASDPMYTPSEEDGLKKADAIAKMTDPMKVFFLRRDQSFEMVPNNSYVDFTPTPPYIDEV